MKILIAPDKFKGTLTSKAAAEAIARGWRKARPQDHLELLPMSDGGDGFGEVLGGLHKARVRSARTVDAARRKCSAPWWWVPSTRTAIVESASVIGLAMLPPGMFHPFELDTYGLGCLLKTVASRGARRCLVGIGGSATNDGGFGMAQALGWMFCDKQGRPIERWTELFRLAQVRAPQCDRLFDEVVVAVDVKNPLLGARGATRVYGPQKGLRPVDLAAAERCLGRLARVVSEELGRNSARVPGAGAAGGLGFALRSFLGAEFKSGFDIFADQAKLRARVKSARLVITGEGAIDASTLMGKGVGQLAAICKACGVPCIGLAGVITTAGREKRLFQGASALTDFTSALQAKRNPERWLERAAESAARSWQEAFWFTTSTPHPLPPLRKRS
jgi:glycerate kinase